MKRLIYIIPALIVFFWIFVSCTKESEIWREEISLVNSAKSWYELAISADPSNESPLEPIWDKAITTESGTGETILIVPVDGGRKANNPGFAILTSIGFKAKDNEIVDANIIQVLGDEEFINERGHTALLNYKNRSVDGLNNGSVLFYDIYYNYLQGKSIKNGKVVSSIGRSD